MGTWTIVLFDNSKNNVDARCLLKTMISNPDPIAEVTEQYRKYWIPQEWKIEISKISGNEELIGPGGFIFRFDEHVLEMRHMLKIMAFAHDSETRHVFRAACKWIADFVGSWRVILPT